jgi:hypothetical protein
MILLHDIRPTTALALPVPLRELKRRGYRIVHVVPATRYRTKTATLPSQWRVRTASRPRGTHRDEGEHLARGGAWPRTVASWPGNLGQGQAAGRSGADLAVIINQNDPEAAAFRRTGWQFSRLLDLPWAVSALTTIDDQAALPSEILSMLVSRLRRRPLRPISPEAG